MARATPSGGEKGARRQANATTRPAGRAGSTSSRRAAASAQKAPGGVRCAVGQNADDVAVLCGNVAELEIARRLYDLQRRGDVWA